jgi:hypothetical protein
MIHHWNQIAGSRPAVDGVAIGGGQMRGVRQERMVPGMSRPIIEGDLDLRGGHDKVTKREGHEAGAPPGVEMGRKFHGF